MANHHGDFIWYELMTSDAPAAEAFYAGLMGWSFRSAGPAGATGYRVFAQDGPEAGGMMQIDAGMQAGGARPLWAGYIGVDEVDATVERVAGEGGSILTGPMDIEGVGRFAFVTDPNGAPFYVMRGISNETSRAFAQDAPRAGHCAWNELHATDPGRALCFYGACFGWEVGHRMDMGPMGAYEMLRNLPHETMLGAVRRATAEGPPPIWHFYFRVSDIDAASAYVTTNGGSVRGEAREIPGGEFTLSVSDPQGAAFSLIGQRAGKSG